MADIENESVTYEDKQQGYFQEQRAPFIERFADALTSKLALAVFFFLLLSAIIIPWALYGSVVSNKPGDPAITGTVRTYFIAANEVEWNYVPDTELAQRQASPASFSKYAANDTNQIGSKYKKILYEEYEDSTFMVRKKRSAEWEHLGLLGPVVRGSVGDAIHFVFKNNAESDLSFSVHPHGVLYSKGSEGTMYADGSCGNDKGDDMVAPGLSYTYKWLIPERAGPGPSDPDSVVWLYHSHVDEIKDTNSGLIGPIIVSRGGAGDSDAKPTDVDREVIVLFSALNENESWYLDDNINTYCGNATSTDPDSDLFVESNVKYSINGYMFGTMPGLAFKQGDRVRWHVVGMGTEMDIHSPAWEGHTVTANGRRVQSYEIIPAEQKTFDMVANNPGQWQFLCDVAKHRRGGMQAFFTVDAADTSVVGPPFKDYTGRIRTYHIAAVELEWDYVPSGTNGLTGESFSTPLQKIDVNGDGTDAMGRKARKAIFREYTNDTFTQERVRPEWSHLGLVGPVIRAQVGDTVVVVFKNLATRPYNMVPTGLISANSSDRFAEVAPGQSRTYTWYATGSSGPASGRDLSSVVWLYRSSVDPVGDGYAGLLGPIIVVRPEDAKFDLSPRDVDRELVTLFAVFDETQSPYLRQNIATYLPGQTNVLTNDTLYTMLIQNSTFVDYNRKRSINGYMYGNLHGLEVVEGQRVRWYVLAIGDEDGLHTPRWYGNAVYWNGEHVDVVEMLPGTTKTVDMNVDSAGIWQIKCQVFNHVERGMAATYTVTDNPEYINQDFKSDRIRPYYIAAEEVEWNYAPSGKNGLTNEPFNEDQEVFTKRGQNTIGSVYRKAVYRGYTDETFTTRIANTSEWEHLGAVGPVIRAEVGDTIVVTFKNMATRPYSIAARGVLTRSADNTSPVQPNEVRTYTWFVPERSGPANGDASSVYWSYRSEVADNDIYAGLYGPLIITAAGKARPDGTPKDVDREFILHLFVSNENLSPYLNHNIQTYCTNQSAVRIPDEFAESNMMHTVNGYVYANVLGLKMTMGERVRWYVAALGNEVDLHGAHFHGNTVLVNGHMTDSQAVLPSASHVMDMIVDNPGRWFFHCHINDHITAGMTALYEVRTPSGDLPSCGSRRRS
mmetsp:Transcript_13022/g.21321  ORF Transcript_13022/g.21321 Transcript_13022/m.21321 type:complete len:1121 (+) Transcript_13022:111-3473(+)